MSSDMALIITTPADQALVEVLSVLHQRYGWTDPLTHPDIHLINQPDEPLTIEKVRQFLGESAYRPYQGEWQYYLLFGLDEASIPAQNALLKILEEPPSQTRVIVTARQPQSILPTIQSRVEIVGASVKTTTETAVTADGEWPTWLATLPTTSYGQIVTWIEAYSDRQAAQELITAGIKHLHQQMVDHPQNSKHAQWVSHQQVLLRTLNHLNQNANVKLTLEAGLFQLKDPHQYPYFP